MEFITSNNVLIEGHNRLVRIPFKNGIVQVKAHEVPSVGGTTIHLMLGNPFELFQILMTHSVWGLGRRCHSRHDALPSHGVKPT
jgi:hypothetical protein